LLAQHPEAMAKLEAELDAAGLLVTTERPQPRAFNFADISKLRYLDCVIKVRVAAQRIAGLCLLHLAFLYHQNGTPLLVLFLALANVMWL